MSTDSINQVHVDLLRTIFFCYGSLGIEVLQVGKSTKNWDIPQKSSSSGMIVDPWHKFMQGDLEKFWL